MYVLHIMHICRSRVNSLEQLSLVVNKQRSKVYKNIYKKVLAIWLDLVLNLKIGPYLYKIEYIKSQSFQSVLVIKVSLFFLYSLMKTNLLRFE